MDLCCSRFVRFWVNFSSRCGQLGRHDFFTCHHGNSAPQPIQPALFLLYRFQFCILMFTLMSMLSGLGLVTAGCENTTVPDGGNHGNDHQPDASSQEDSGSGESQRDAQSGSDTMPDKQQDCEAGEGLLWCDGVCVDGRTSIEHCGLCDWYCEQGQECHEGVCVVSSCPEGSGLTLCDGQCVDTDVSLDHCGECGIACTPDVEICQEGVCTPDCDLNQTLCSGECVYTQSDVRHCGTCDNGCGSGRVCSAGQCAFTCGDGLTLCGEWGCVDLNSNRTNCGQCLHGCSSGQICEEGVCFLPCQHGWEDCGGTCANTSSDAMNCGSCGFTCGAGARCDAGNCIKSVTGVNLSRATAEMRVGQSVQLVATVLPPDAFNKSVVWSSFSTAVATVDSWGMVTAVGSGQSIITVSTVEGGHRATCVVNVDVAVDSVTLEPSSLTLMVGGEATLTATVLPVNATNKAITWQSTNPQVAVVDNTGRVSAISEGTTSIKVTTADGGLFAVCSVDVGRVSVTGITVRPLHLPMKKGEKALLVPTITPADASNKSVLWFSSNTDVATVNASGLVTAVDSGSASISVITVDGNFTASSSVTVIVPVTFVRLDKTALNLNRGQSATLHATVLPENATNQDVTWESDNPVVATVNSQGRVEAIAEGEAEISVVTSEGGQTATCVVTVRVAVEGVLLEPAEATISVGESFSLVGSVVPLDATEQGITWSSTVDSVATVNQSGTVFAQSPGDTVIYAVTVEGAFSANAQVSVRPLLTSVSLDRTSLAMTPGEEDDLVATLLPAEALERRVTWSSSNDNVATVDDNGHVVAAGVGQATITVRTVQGGHTAQCAVEVSAIMGNGTSGNPYRTSSLKASCLQYRQEFASLPSSFFRISRSGVESVVYCDMTTDGGGYTFLKVQVGSTYNAQQAESHCAGLGMRLFIPRTQAHYLSAQAIARNGSIPPGGDINFLYIMGIYPRQQGSTCSAMPLTSSNSSCGWRAGDDGPFWVTDRTNITEPNGDNHPASSMGYNYDANGLVSYNDLNHPGYASALFVCDPADKR